MKTVSIELQAFQIATMLDTAQDSVLTVDCQSNLARAGAVYLFAAYATADKLADEMGRASGYGADVASAAHIIERAIKLLGAGPALGRRTLRQVVTLIQKGRETLLSVAVAHDDCVCVLRPSELQEKPLLLGAG